MNDQRLPYLNRLAALPGVTGNTDICLILGDSVAQMPGGAPAASHTEKRSRASA